jgi:hypothetical protein
MIPALIALRSRYGADTPPGHRCSNTGEQLKNIETAAPLARRNLQKLLRQSHDDLSRLSRQRE